MAVAFLNRISNFTKDEKHSPMILQQKSPQGRVCLWNSIYTFLFKIFGVYYNSRFYTDFLKSHISGKIYLYQTYRFNYKVSSSS